MTAQRPRVDYHVHLSPDLTLENAVKLASERQMQFGIVEHPGPGAGIENDTGLENYIATLRRHPVFVGLSQYIAIGQQRSRRMSSDNWIMY